MIAQRVIMALVFCIIVAGGMFAVPAQLAAAACSGSGYNRLAPIATGCGSFFNSYLLGPITAGQLTLGSGSVWAG